MPTMEEKLRSVCQDRCAEEHGDPPCWEIVKDEPSLGEWSPCAECKADCGLPVEPEPLDPEAVMRPLI